MKNYIKLFVLSLVAVLAFSFAASATKQAYVPSAGIKTYGDLTDLYGKIGYDDNGNKFRYVLNNSGTQEYYGQPAFYEWSSGNDYTVGTYESTSSYEAFAGIWWCAADATTIIAADAYGWIQISGTCLAYISGESSSLVGDVLAGTVVTGTLDSAGDMYLVRDRVLATSSTASSSYETRTLDWPRQSAAYTTESSALTRILIRSGF